MQRLFHESNMMRLQLENHSDRPAPYHFVNVDNQKGWEWTFTIEPKESVFGTSVSTALRFSYHPLLLSGTFWCRLLSSHFAVEFNIAMLNRCKTSRESRKLHSARGVFWLDRPMGVIPPDSFMVVTVLFGPMSPINYHKKVGFSWDPADQIFEGSRHRLTVGVLTPFAQREKVWPKSWTKLAGLLRH